MSLSLATTEGKRVLWRKEEEMMKLMFLDERERMKMPRLAKMCI